VIIWARPRRNDRVYTTTSGGDANIRNRGRMLMDARETSAFPYRENGRPWLRGRLWGVGEPLIRR
jgi:hypothetical protein